MQTWSVIQYDPKSFSNSEVQNLDASFGLSLNPRDVYRSNLTAANLIPPDETICANKQQNSPLCPLKLMQQIKG